MHQINSLLPTPTAIFVQAASYCGAPVKNGVRNFCRQASCAKCVRFASEARAHAFVADCARARRRGDKARWAAVSAPVIDFARWRGFIHDRLAYRRATDLRRWQEFGMLLRWDGRMVAGIAHIPALGLFDLTDLLAGDDGSAGVESIAGDPELAAEELLTAAPASELDLSLKGIFFTARPACRVRRKVPRHRTSWDEPMPFLF